VFHAALGATGGEAGFVGSHALAAEVFLEKREMGGNLPRQVLLDAPVAEEAEQPCDEPPKMVHDWDSSTNRRSTRPAIRFQRSVSSPMALRPAFVIA
jgi:hypothetical protein